ncbi:MAG: DUF501 domain-containing protein [Thermoleophilia bacterium]
MSGGAPRDDAAAVAALLGRPSHTEYRVAVRCPHGGPAVLENDPVDRRGRPFPTRHWLACTALGEAVSRLEAAGGVRRLEEDTELAGALAEAQRHHAALQGGHNVGGVADPRRVKCLHAHLAFGLATGGNPVSDWILRESGAAWPPVCCVPAEGA